MSLPEMIVLLPSVQGHIASRAILPEYNEDINRIKKIAKRKARQRALSVLEQ